MKNITPPNFDEVQLIVSTAGDAKAALSEKAPALKKDLMTQSQRIVAVQSPEQLQIAVHAVRELKRLCNAVESARKLVKQPVINLGKRIDAIAEEYTAEMQAEILRIGGDGRMIKGLVGVFAEAEQKKADAEAERIRVETEKAQLEAQAALAEQERIANLSRPSVKREVEAAKTVETAMSNLAAVSGQVVAPVATAAGLKPKFVLDFKITNAAALYAARPEWFELVPRQQAIKSAITKTTKLPGLEVTEVLDTKIRA